MQYFKIKFMEKNKLKELIIGQKEKLFSKAGLVVRNIQKDIEKFLKSKEIILITGVRRSGKSCLMRLISDDLTSKFNVPQSNILYLNFEDERFTDFTVNDFDLLYETYLEIESPKGRKYFFLDELQNIAGWEKWVNRLYEFEDIKFFITGSNATLLSSEISSALTGRNRQIINWPFSFLELLGLRSFTIEKNKTVYSQEKRVTIKKYFKEYLELGGFPEVLINRDNTILEQYFRDIIYRDVVARYSIRNIKELKELCLYLISNIGTINSYENLRECIQAKNIGTIKNYIEILENVFLFFRLPMFDYSIKRQIYNPGKFYVVDTGLFQSIGFKFSKNIGRIYENIVFLELKRRNKEIYYWKSKSGKEVDFVVRKGLKIEEAIQVCYDLSDPKTKEREISGLIAGKIELKPARLTVITEDEEKVGKENIRYIPLWKWLIKEDKLGVSG